MPILKIKESDRHQIFYLYKLYVDNKTSYNKLHLELRLHVYMYYAED